MPYIQPFTRSFALGVTVLALIPAAAFAQVSIGAKAAASAPGANSSANGGTGGVGFGGIGPGVGVNQGVTAGAGVMPSGRAVGDSALSGPRARLDAQRELPAGADTPARPLTSGQRALALDAARRDPEARQQNGGGVNGPLPEPAGGPLRIPENPAPAR